jgi:hypothetical protein
MVGGSAALPLRTIRGFGRKVERVKHFIIAATLGGDISLKALRMEYTNGNTSKEAFAAALRARQKVRRGK